MTCKSARAFEEFKNSGVSFRGSLIQIRPCRSAKWVNLTRLSYGIQQEAIVEALRPYGRVLQVKMDQYRGVYVGVRNILMEISQPIPSSIRVAEHWCNVFYPGQVPTCFACRQAGHTRANCPRAQAPIPRVEAEDPPVVIAEALTELVGAVAMNVSEDVVEQVTNQTGAEVAPIPTPPSEDTIVTVPMAIQGAAVDVDPDAPAGAVRDKTSITPEGVVAQISDVTIIPEGTAVGSSPLSMQQEIVVPGPTVLEEAVVSTVPDKRIDDSVAQQSGFDRRGDPQGSPPKSYAEAVASSNAKVDDVAGDVSFDFSEESESEYDEVFVDAEVDPGTFKRPLSDSSGSSEDFNAPSTKRGKALSEAVNVPLPGEDSDLDDLDSPLVGSGELDCNIDTSSDITDSPLSQFPPNLPRDRGYTQPSSGPSQLLADTPSGTRESSTASSSPRVEVPLKSSSFLYDPFSSKRTRPRPVSGTFGKK